MKVCRSVIFIVIVASSCLPGLETTPTTKTSDKTVSLSEHTTKHLTSITPRPLEGTVTISEVYYSSKENSTIADYIELTGDAKLTLTNYTIVIYGWGFVSKQIPTKTIISLDGTSISATGSFMIGQTNAGFHVDVQTLEHGVLNKRHTTMVALYKGTPTTDHPTTTNLVDYVVYGLLLWAPSDLKSWIPKVQVHLNSSRFDNESISRCFSNEPKNSRAFMWRHMTPDAPNNCSKIQVTVSQVAYQATSANLCRLTITLHSSEPSTDLSSFFVVFYQNKNGTILNHTIDLWNGRSGHDGSSTAGSNPACNENINMRIYSAEAVVLYQFSDDLTPFYAGRPSKDNIRFDMVYSINSTTLVDQISTSVLSEGHTTVYLNDSDSMEQLVSGNKSLSLCHGQYMLTAPSSYGPYLCNPTTSTMTTTTNTIETTSPESTAPITSGSASLNSGLSYFLGYKSLLLFLAVMTVVYT